MRASTSMTATEAKMMYLPPQRIGPILCGLRDSSWSSTARDDDRRERSPVHAQPNVVRRPGTSGIAENERQETPLVPGLSRENAFRAKRQYWAKSARVGTTSRRVGIPLAR